MPEGSTGSLAGSASAPPPPSPSPILASVGRHPKILDAGRYSLTVAGVPFSFDIPQGWERFGSISINTSTAGSQDAEAMIVWSSYPDVVLPDPCTDLLGPEIGPSVADLADAVSRAPGTSLVAGPWNVTVGGRSASFVVLTVGKDIGCDPGFFFTWWHERWGAFWSGTHVGDAISMWIVDVEGRRLVIEAQTHPRGSDVEQEIEQIIGSIRFPNLSMSPEAYFAQAAAICDAANHRVRVASANLPGSGLQLKAAASRSAAEISADTFAQLHVLRWEEADDTSIVRFFSRMRRQTEILRELAAAASAGDADLTDALDGDLVRAAQRKDAVAAQLAAVWGASATDLQRCPVSLSG